MKCFFQICKPDLALFWLASSYPFLFYKENNDEN